MTRIFIRNLGRGSSGAVYVIVIGSSGQNLHIRELAAGRGRHIFMRFAALLLFSLLLPAQGDVVFRIALPKTQFHMGETIPVEMAYSSASAGYRLDMRTQDRVGRENMMERFEVAPAAGTTDPLGAYFNWGPAGMGGLGSAAALSTRPVTLRKDLNEWVRFDRPGAYRLTVESRRVYGVVLRSNTVAFTILPRDPAWEAGQIADPTPRVLRFLNTPEAVRECARRLDGTGGADLEYKFCLLGTSHRDLALKEMTRLFEDPRQPVPGLFVETLARLQADAKTWMAAQNALLDRLAKLAGTKQGVARAMAFKTLLEANRPVPAGEMAASFEALPAMEQNNLLQWRWRQIAGPEFLPVLRRIYENPPEPRYDPPIRDIALKRLYELDAAGGRRLILAEMGRPAPRVRVETLTLLADAALPQAEGAIMTNLEGRDSDRRALETLLARYGTRAVFARAKAFYAKVDAEMRARPANAWNMTSPPVRSLSAPAVEPPLIAYFLKVEPAYGEIKLREALAERWAEVGRGWLTVLGETGRLEPPREWEKVAVEALQDGMVQVKLDAAKALSQYGSAAAQKPLLECFRYWHDWWKDRAAEMNDENRYFEIELWRALAYGKSWLAGPALLADIRAQCVTPACRQQVDGTMQSWTQPLVVFISDVPSGEWRAQFAQYWLTSADELKAKLALLPPGVPVTCRTAPGQDDLCRVAGLPQP